MTLADYRMRIILIIMALLGNIFVIMARAYTLDLRYVNHKLREYMVDMISAFTLSFLVFLLYKNIDGVRMFVR